MRETIDSAGTGLANRGDEHDLAVKTWRYLRVGLIALAVGLAVAVLHARSLAECWQTSISAYYYTPASGVLVGVLVAIGVCLICLRGASDGEDVLLDLAGICAPFIALVPTPNKSRECGKVLVSTSERYLNVGTNVTALLVVAWLALAFIAVITVRRKARPSPVAVRGFWAAVLLVLVANVVFVVFRTFFLSNAHNAAAVLFFVFILANVRLNAFQRYAAEEAVGLTPGRFNRYTRITVAMAAVIAVHVALIIGDWSHWVLTLEASLIALFVWFWVAQTSERWDDGISPIPSAEKRREQRRAEEINAH
ncbi:hypothetical protein [Blastococcus sp. SYSU D01042]